MGRRGYGGYGMDRRESSIYGGMCRYCSRKDNDGLLGHHGASSLNELGATAVGVVAAHMQGGGKAGGTQQAATGGLC